MPYTFEDSTPAMPATPLSSYVDRFPDTRLLCVGDMMLDTFVYGTSARLSPEAPVPVMLKQRERSMLGGAGNVVANLCRLGCRTSFAGVVGADADGEKLRNDLLELGAEADLLLELTNYSTSVKTRYVAGNHHLLRVDREVPLRMTPDEVALFLEKIEARLPRVDLVLLSDYGKGLFDERTTPALIALSHKYGCPVIIDPKRTDYTIYSGATLVKPNLKEFCGAIGRTLSPSDPDFREEALTTGRELCRKYSIGNLLVTLSEHGMMFIPGREEEPSFIIPTEAREVFDVSGAGDTSLAALGAALAAGADMEQAIRLANAASGIVVGKFGTACATPAELRGRLMPGTSSRILTVEQAVEMATDLKARGKRIGFTNGCFDLLHPGHLQSFQLARQECDVLFVGMNSDASVHRLKGEGRPVNDERSRAAMLSGLKPVDYVVIFEEDTALPLIEALRPDVIAKEGYPLERWPEGRAVIAYGGRAVELPRLEGFSTTNIIRKLS